MNAKYFICASNTIVKPGKRDDGVRERERERGGREGGEGGRKGGREGGRERGRYVNFRKPFSSFSGII